MLIHATSVVIDGFAVLLAGPPGAGKSDVALRLIDGGAFLLSDDQVFLRCENNVLLATSQPSIEGRMEIRHVGIVKMPFAACAPVALHIELTPMEEALERLPELDLVVFLEHPIPRLRLPAFAASTPAKIRATLKFIIK